MSELTIEHTCGHTVRHRFEGPDALRRKRQQWLAERPCQQCWQQQERQAAEAGNQERNLPPLQGTDDDIAWAEVIRAKAFERNFLVYERVSRPKTGTGRNEEADRAISEAAQKAIQELTDQDSAAWWIEKRFELPNFVREAALKAGDAVLNRTGDAPSA